MAPFKLRFSKMLKSRSKGSRSSSTECDEPTNQQNQHSSNSRPETPAIECNSIPPINESAAFPNSPPPSYEHVLQETRFKRTTSGEEEEEEEEDEEEAESGEDTRRANASEQRTLTGSCVERGGVGDDGGPGGGGSRIEATNPEILHKSSKELYRAVAKQWGLTCKMTDHCRCFDCQSHYFDCDYEKGEQGKNDGGLGAGTPMFIAEVMHGTACVLL